MSKLTEYNEKLAKKLNENRHDEDKVLFALGMVVKRAEDKESIAYALHEAFISGSLGALGELIDLELIEDSSQTVIMEMI